MSVIPGGTSEEATPRDEATARDAANSVTGTASMARGFGTTEESPAVTSSSEEAGDTPSPRVGHGHAAMTSGPQSLLDRNSSGDVSDDEDIESLRTRSLYKYPDRRPAEVEVRSGDDEDDYITWRETTDLRDPYRIPGLFLRGTKPYAGPAFAEAPLIVFVNSKSGGLTGPRVETALCRAVSGLQVFDVSRFRPGDVLSTIHENLRKRIAKGDNAAAYIAKNLNVLCCGGDGTVAWVLKTIQDLRLDPQPHVAVCPLGTGNDLALSFGWGNVYQPRWFKGHRNTYKTLARISLAQRCDLDCWRVSLRVPSSDLFNQLPHSMEEVHKQQPPAGQPQGSAEMAGLFWNYLSFGIDAEAAWGFSHLRETRPALASRRALNMAWYSFFSCTSGWFCPRRFALQNMLRVRAYARMATGMEEVKISHGISAIVLLNLQSYGGGRDLWGLKNSDPDAHTHKSFKPPIFNDGKFEVVGLRSGWHTAFVMGKFSSRIHATRLAQTDEFLLTAWSNGPIEKKTYMQLDGEPWPQAVPPEGGDPLRLHVKLHGKSSMLFNTEFAQGSIKTKHAVGRAATLSKVNTMEQAPRRSFASALLDSQHHQHQHVHGHAGSMATGNGSVCSMAPAGLTPLSTTQGPYASRDNGGGLSVLRETSFEGGNGSPNSSQPSYGCSPSAHHPNTLHHSQPSHDS